jgi:UDP-N-acetylglucosamine transferase subunit ALG13
VTCRVFVTVGTDHHPFPRLVQWIDAWLTSAPDVECLVQTGTSPRPARAHAEQYLSYERMTTAMSDATAVVCHGGPATIMECRRVGLMPIVVPRDPALGEHVDGHQQAFSRLMSERGQIALAQSESELRDLLDRALVDPAMFRIDRTASGVSDAVARFEAELASLVTADQRR